MAKTQMITIPLLLSEGRMGYLIFPWPLTRADLAFAAWQLDHHLETIRRLNQDRWEQEEQEAAGLTVGPNGAD